MGAICERWLLSEVHLDGEIIAIATYKDMSLGRNLCVANMQQPLILTNIRGLLVGERRIRAPYDWSASVEKPTKGAVFVH